MLQQRHPAIGDLLSKGRAVSTDSIDLYPLVVKAILYLLEYLVDFILGFKIRLGEYNVHRSPLNTDLLDKFQIRVGYGAIGTKGDEPNNRICLLGKIYGCASIPLTVLASCRRRVVAGSVDEADIAEAFRPHLRADTHERHHTLKVEAERVNKGVRNFFIELDVQIDMPSVGRVTTNQAFISRQYIAWNGRDRRQADGQANLRILDKAVDELRLTATESPDYSDDGSFAYVRKAHQQS